MKLLVATTNKGKARELIEAGAGYDVELIVPQEKIEVVEDGENYYDNALLKAVAYSSTFNMPAIADDSGLEVEAMGWGPGLYTARYGGEGLSDQERYQLMLSELDGKESKARYRCTIVVVDRQEVIAQATSQVDGKIISSPRGGGGFGYDPIFEVEGLSKTLAEIDFEQNLEIGFRANAARSVYSALTS